MKSNLARSGTAAVLALSCTAGAWAASGAQPPSPRVFAVQIAGLDVVAMTRVQFLDADPRDRPRRDGDAVELRLTRALGRVVGPSTDFLRWAGQRGADGRADRRDVSIVVYDNTNAERGRITLGSCAALSWRGPDLSTQGEVAAVTESIDIRCASVRLDGAF